MEEAEKLNKAYTVIKETEKKKFGAKEIVEIMHIKGYSWFTTNKMTNCWKNELGNREAYGVYVMPGQCYGMKIGFQLFENIVRKRTRNEIER